MAEGQMNNINQIIEYLENCTEENSLREQDLKKLSEVVTKLMTYQEEPSEVTLGNVEKNKSNPEKPIDKSSTKRGLTRSFFELPEIITRRIFLSN